MEVFEMVTIVVGFGCATGVITTFIDKAFGGKQKQAQLEAKMAQERARLLELQIVEAHRQNDQLTKQLEWHTKMLETQDRLMKSLTDGKPQSHAESPAVSRS
jgi:uncharacterized membrane protein YgaE (UPF0421/DUF939 family)